MKSLFICSLLLLTATILNSEEVQSSFSRNIVNKGSQLIINARLGDCLRLQWDEKRRRTLNGWVGTTGSMKLYCIPPWEEGRGGPMVNWDINRWLDIKVGNKVGPGVLRSAGKCDYKQFAVADFFWSLSKPDDPAVIYARFMRSTSDGYLFMRLEVPASEQEETVISFKLRSYDAVLRNNKYSEKVIYSGDGRASVSQTEGQKVFPMQIPVDEKLPALVVSQGIDAFHSGVGIIYDPDQIEKASLNLDGNATTFGISLKIKPGQKTVYLALWNYRNLSIKNAFEQLAADVPATHKTFKDADWQITRSDQVLDYKLIQKRYLELEGLKKTPKEMGDRLDRVFSQIENIAEKGKEPLSSQELGRAYELQDQFRHAGLAIKRWWLEEHEKAFRQGVLEPGKSKRFDSLDLDIEDLNLEE